MDEKGTTVGLNSLTLLVFTLTLFLSVYANLKYMFLQVDFDFHPQGFWFKASSLKKKKKKFPSLSDFKKLLVKGGGGLSALISSEGGIFSAAPAFSEISGSEQRH